MVIGADIWVEKAPDDFNLVISRGRRAVKANSVVTTQVPVNPRVSSMVGVETDNHALSTFLVILVSNLPTASEG